MGKKGKAETGFTAKEWNAGGAIHFYGSEKPRTFMVEVFTADSVQGNLLQAAVDKTLERMPYYRQTFVRKRGLYYYADDDLPFLVAQSEKPRTVGDITTNYHMLDVNYFDRMIRFSMFHGLCDGLGLNRFIEAVLYHYFCLKDGKEYNDEGIVTSKVPFDPAETYDVYDIKTKAKLREISKLTKGDKRFRLPELESNKGPLMYRFPLRIRTGDLLSWCKASSASPSTAITAFVGKAIAAERDVQKGVIMSVVPFSMRKYLHAEKTFKNCASAVFLPMKPDECAGLPASELAAKLRTDLKNVLNEEWSLLLVSSINLVTRLGKLMPFYWLKNKIMAVTESNPQDTFSVDYVGGLKTGEYSDQITEVRYLNPDVFKGSLFVVLSETAGYFHINFNQTFDSTVYYDGFIKCLNELNIPCEKLSPDTFLNPEVELPGEQR